MAIPRRVVPWRRGGGGRDRLYCGPWTTGWEYGQLTPSAIASAGRSRPFLSTCEPLEVDRRRSADFMSYWQDKVCVVSGGSAGLGLAIGRALAQNGARVVLTARRQEVLDAAVAELNRAGGKVIGVVGDMAWQ